MLALLLVHANRHVPTDQLEDELWDGAPPPAARSTLHAHVSRLRSLLLAMGGSATLAGKAGGYELTVDPSDIDAHRFEGFAVQANRVLSDDPQLASDMCARALDEWRGPALQDVRNVSALYLEAQRLDELRLATIEDRLTAELAVGGHVMAVASLQRLVEEHPYREQLRGLLMVALFRSGRQAEALRAYQAGYAALADIGLRPGRELRAIAESVSSDDPALQLRAGSLCTLVQRPVASQDNSGEQDRECGVQLFEGPLARCAVQALVEEARREGRTVLRARAHDGRRHPYQCVAEALAPLLDERSDPALARIVGAVPPAPGGDPAFQRFQSFEAVLNVLVAHSARRPVTLVLDHVDRAGTSTLDLLEHIARRRGDAAVAVIAARATTCSGDVFDAKLLQLERDGLLRRVPLGAGDPAIGPGPISRAQPEGLDHADLAADAFLAPRGCRRGPATTLCCASASKKRRTTIELRSPRST